MSYERGVVAKKRKTNKGEIMFYLMLLESRQALCTLQSWAFSQPALRGATLNTFRF